MTFVDDFTEQALTPSRRYGPHAPQVDQVDSWNVGKSVACDLAWPDGSVGRYWIVMARAGDEVRLEFVV